MANISGGSGNDILSGTSANDKFTGNGGADTFRFVPTTGGFGADTITDFVKGVDRIDLSAFTAITSLSMLSIVQGANHKFIITIPGATGGTIEVSNPGGTLTLSDLTAGIVITGAPCYLRGTLIRTPQGDVAIETLAIGDLVETLDGVARPVRWIGRRSYGGPFLEHNEVVSPVEIRQGAFGDLPRRDLLVSPEHAIKLGEALVPARHLVNGESIRQRFDLPQIDYFHLEFETGEVIFAEGLAAESYVCCENRRQFANYAEFVALYGEQDAGATRRRLPLVEEGEALESLLASLPRKAQAA